MFPKALASGADIVCVDLEDAVAPQDKAAARDQTFDGFQRAEGPTNVERIVRINCVRTIDGMRDLDAVIHSRDAVAAIMLPKVKSAAEVAAVSELLEEHQMSTRLHIIIETNEALEAAFEIARSSDRIDALFFGGVDMAAELRCQPTWDALRYARSRVVHAAAAAGVDVLDVPFLELENHAGMRREAELAAELGFVGKGAIHPSQIRDLNAVFTPDEATVERARRIIAAFAETGGALLVYEGKLIEKPVLRSLSRTIAAYAAAHHDAPRADSSQ